MQNILLAVDVPRMPRMGVSTSMPTPILCICFLFHSQPHANTNAQDTSEHIHAHSCPVCPFPFSPSILCEHSGCSIFFPSQPHTNTQDRSKHICACFHPVHSFFLSLSTLHECPGHERVHLCLPLSCALISPSPLNL